MNTIVFDMDGVLFDTERLHMEIWNQILREWGFAEQEEIYNLCIGVGRSDAEATLRRFYGKDFPVAEFLGEMEGRAMQEMAESGVPVKPGVLELLACLRDAGWRIGLASSTKYDVVMDHLKRAKISAYFSKVVTGDMVEHSKPSPEIYLMACGELGVEPCEAYAVEDSFNGIRAAHSAGMKAIMVPDVIAPDEEMKKLAFRIFGDLLEVKAFLMKEA